MALLPVLNMAAKFFLVALAAGANAMPVESAGVNDLDWAKYIECWTPPDGGQGYWKPGTYFAKKYPGLTLSYDWCMDKDPNAPGTSADFGCEGKTQADNWKFDGTPISCYMEKDADGQIYRVIGMPAGEWGIDEQVWIPPFTKLIGAKNPNDKADPYHSELNDQTLFKASVPDSWSWLQPPDYGTPKSGTGKGSNTNGWCGGGRGHPLESKKERRGFVLHSNTQLMNVVIQGAETVRAAGIYCGGAAIETPGCIGQYGGGVETGANWDKMGEYSDPTTRWWLYAKSGAGSVGVLDGALYDKHNDNSQKYASGCYDNYRVQLPYTQSPESAQKIASKDWLVGGYETGTPVSNITIENVRTNDPKYFYPSLTSDQIRKAERICDWKDEQKSGVHCKATESGAQDFMKWPATQGALYTPPQADGGATTNVQVKNLFSLTSVSDGINIRSSHQVTFEDIFIANSGDDALAAWAGAGEADLYFKGDFIVASNPGIRQEWGNYGNCFAAYGGKKVVFENFICETKSCYTVNDKSDPNSCIPAHGSEANTLWGETSFGSVYRNKPKVGPFSTYDNMFVFGHNGGAFVWADLKESSKVGEYKYRKDTQIYWRNLGVPLDQVDVTGMWLKWLGGQESGYPNVWVNDTSHPIPPPDELRKALPRTDVGLESRDRVHRVLGAEIESMFHV